MSVALMERGVADMVERDELDAALKELQLSVTGLTSKESQTKLGKLIGAKILITGSIFREGEKSYIVAKVIGTETSRVRGASASGAGSFTEMVPELAEKVAVLIEKDSAKLLPKELKTTTTALKLAEVVKGQGRKVFIQVKEDISVSAPDPAAEIELRKLALALGFDVVPTRDAADFALIGEAIASNSGTYQRFTSAVARVELSIYGRGKKLVAAGSAKDTVAGGSYVIAAKSAIAQATLSLAEELFPAMK
ncbi:MAG: CsgG/HfaB family protein [Victivallaceae bacterium]